MRRLALLFVVVFTACAPAVVAPSPSPSAAITSEPSPSPTAAVVPTSTPSPKAPPPVQVEPPRPQVPQPQVLLRNQTFAMGTPPVAQRMPLPLGQAQIVNGFATQLMNFLDSARGGGPYQRIGPMTDDEWNSRVWPGEFQKIARAVATAKPAQGRFFFSDEFTVDTAWALPWNVPTGYGGSTAIQFVDVTLKFRDHAETPPTSGDILYIWHLRLPTTGQNVYAIADGYDETHAKTWMSTATYWDQARLEREAVSALSGYLWEESYVKDGYPRYANVPDTTPFWHSRHEALDELNTLFGAGRLTDRHFEGAAVRIDGFEPLTVYGGGIVSITLTGRLVETLDGKPVRVDFTQPMKFYRFSANPVSMAGWIAVDSFEDGAWVSGGNLALDRLSTAHG